jgi:hypothetical protein
VVKAATEQQKLDIHSSRQSTEGSRLYLGGQNRRIERRSRVNMRLTKKEKETLKRLAQNEIDTLTEFINEKGSKEMNFKTTKKYLEELENIVKKLQGEG